MKFVKAAIASLALAAAFFFAFIALTPRFSKPLSTAIYDSTGSLLGASVAADGQWRLAPGPVPEKIARAITGFEDRRFALHPGVDPLALVRAVIQNASSGKIVSGGSTLTMQTVRLARNNPGRTIGEKIKEAFLSIVLEMRYTKKEILSLYAANAPFGGNVVGIEAASWRYWGRPPESLDWAEAATLAVLPNQPTLVHPGADRDRLLEKRDRLLRELFREGYIEAGLLDLSIQEPLPAAPYPLPHLAPHYLARFTAGGHITTTIDRKFQVSVTSILERWSAEFDARGIHNAAALVIDTETGAVVAYAGNTGSEREESHNADVDIITSKRSSGSILKPFLFAAMLDAGLILTNQLVVDIPTRVGSYMPENNVPVYQGVVPASEALSRSLNVPAVRELRDYGIAPFLDCLRKSGFTTFTRTADDYGLQLILGGGEVTLEEAVRAYAGLMRRANPADDSRQKQTPAARGFPESPFSTGAAWLTLEALIEGTRPNDEELWRSFASGRKIAWKTGTSYGNRDAWAIGTTPRYTVGIWVGNATGEGRPELKSISTAAPVLFDIFSILPMTEWPKRPELDLREVTVCEDSGFLAGSDCARKATAFKPANAGDGNSCPYCRMVSLTPDGTQQATADDLTGTGEGTLPRIEKRFVLPPAIEYWYSRHALDYHPLPPWVDGHSGDSAKLELAIVFPETGARIFIPVEVDGKRGALVMQATHRDPSATLYWDIDGEYLGETRNFHQLSVRPLPGNHVLTVTASSGIRAIRKFEILSADDSV